jgi:hypothetical protein
MAKVTANAGTNIATAERDNCIEVDIDSSAPTTDKDAVPIAKKAKLSTWSAREVDRSFTAEFQRCNKEASF